MKTLEAYAEARVRAILRALEKYHQFQETDSLHRLRVEIKKLKSILLILEHADKRFDAHEEYIALRNIFRKAGQIRQPAVMQELLMAHGMEVPLGRLGDSQKAKDKFRSHTPLFMTRVEKLGKRILPRWKHVRRKEISGYMKSLLKKVRKSFVPSMKTAQLHTTRKRLKKVVYLSRLTKQLSKKEVQFYASLEAAIGSLHDKQVLLEFLGSLPRREVTVQTRPIRLQVEAEREAISKLAGKFFRK